jgi:hypothetical protein
MASISPNPSRLASRNVRRNSINRRMGIDSEFVFGFDRGGYYTTEADSKMINGQPATCINVQMW